MRVVVVCAATVLGVVQAAPCEAQDSSERLERARLAFDSGMRAFDQGDMVGAREGFEQAYALTESPTIRFNLGLVEERVGHFELAAAHYRAYLASGVPADEETEVRARLSAVEARIPAAPIDPSPADEPPAELAVEPQPEPARRGPDFTAAALTMGVGLAVSGALFGLAGGFWASANDHYASFSGCAPACSADDVAASGAMMEVDLTNGLLIAGAVTTLATLGVSIALFATAGQGGVDAQVQLGPGHLSLRGRF